MIIKQNPLYNEIVKGLHWNLDYSNHRQSHYPCLPKKPRAYLLIVWPGDNDITENEILRACKLSSGKNYCSELERKLTITLKRIDEPNTDGISSHYRYYLTNKEDTQKMVNLIRNYEHSLLTESDISQILALYQSKIA